MLNHSAYKQDAKRLTDKLRSEPYYFLMKIKKTTAGMNKLEAENKSRHLFIIVLGDSKRIDHNTDES